MPPSSDAGRSGRPATSPGTAVRTLLGALLLPLNPLVGLILGLAVQSAVPWSPIVLAWAFLPATYLGIALLSGAFGPSAWSLGAPEGSGGGSPGPTTPVAGNA